LLRRHSGAGKSLPLHGALWAEAILRDHVLLPGAHRTLAKRLGLTLSAEAILRDHVLLPCAHRTLAKRLALTLWAEAILRDHVALLHACVRAERALRHAI